MQFLQAFPIAIIDEDYEGKHAAGPGMRQLAAAIEKEGFRVVAGLSYEDARRLVNVFNTESCWLVSVDGAEATPTQWQVLEVCAPVQRLSGQAWQAHIGHETHVVTLSFL